MHGRPRPPKGSKPDPAAEQKAAQKAALYATLAGEVLSRRQSMRYDDESMGLAGRLLELNPEVYTAWNYRKERVAAVLDGEDREAAAAAAQAELALTEKALMKNPKSYATWQHRKWVVARRLTPIDREMALVGYLLDADERNFHGWGYRRWLVALAGITPEDELEYTHKKIEQNFSNYSAWHYRTALLPKVHAGAQTLSQMVSGADAEQTGSCGEAGRADGTGAAAARTVPMWVLLQELELVQQAFFTEPEDQSGWFYHRWLLGACLTSASAAAASEECRPEDSKAFAELKQALTSQAEMCKELLEEEPAAKWPLLTLARVRELEANLPGSPQSLLAEAHEIYGKLEAVDAMRAGYYRDALSGSARVTIQQA
mmetsp:Transcript_30333/g.85729  ORF Transcript_30333/g.85729 Transcript_30333/m.85729 type:complete len:372 (+) Transcript_30333:98-1213(+)